MNAPTILITGCNGLIGRAVTERLVDRYRVVGADVEEPAEDSPLTECRYMDVSSDLSVAQTVEHLKEHYDGKLASVIHLAAYYDFTGEPSPLYDEITVQGTRRLLQTLREHDIDVEQFVFTSTMLVHAPVKPGEHIDESSPFGAKWAYPRSKVETEQVIRTEHGDIPAVFLRIAGVYTDYGKQPTLVHQIKRIHGKDLESFFFPGDVEAGQSLVHIDDAADAIVRAVEHRDELGPETPILIGEPNPPSYAALQDAIGEELWGREWPSIRMPEKLAQAGAWLQDNAPGSDSFIKPYMIELADDHYGLDISRARDRLGWEPSHHIMDVLSDIIAGLREDPEAWYEKNGVEAPDSVTHSAEAGA